MPCLNRHTHAPNICLASGTVVNREFHRARHPTKAENASALDRLALTSLNLRGEVTLFVHALPSSCISRVAPSLWPLEKLVETLVP